MTTCVLRMPIKLYQSAVIVSSSILSIPVSGRFLWQNGAKRDTVLWYGMVYMTMSHSSRHHAKDRRDQMPYMNYNSWFMSRGSFNAYPTQYGKFPSTVPDTLPHWCAEPGTLLCWVCAGLPQTQGTRNCAKFIVSALEKYFVDLFSYFKKNCCSF